MRGRFEAHIDMASMRSLKRGRVDRRLVLEVAKDDADSVRAMLEAYEKDAVKRVEQGEQPRQVAFLWDIAYGKRSLSKNRLQWSLLTLTVRFLNEGMPDGLEKMTPLVLYNQDMGDVAPCKAIVVEAKELPWLSEAGVRVKNAVPIEGSDLVQAYVVKTSSQFDEMEEHRYLEHLFNRLAMMGIPEPREPRLKGWWKDWMQDINDHRLELHADVVSKDAYRELHPLCEGCGPHAFLGAGGGHLAHIKSVGAGGEAPELANGREWLHLCAECHLGLQHAKGWEAFKQAHPHLVNKVDAALAARGGES